MILREFKSTDLDIFTFWLEQEHVRKYFHDPEDWIDEVVDQNAQFGWIHHFIAEEDGVPVGFCQYYDCKYSDETWGPFEGSDRTFSIDYLIGPNNLLRQGHAQKMVGLLIGLIISTEDSKRIVVQPEEGNTASCGLLTSLGFSKDAASQVFFLEPLSVNGKDYWPKRLIGHGKGGYSYLAKDSLVLKKIHHEPCDYYSFGDKIAAELNDYKRLGDAGIRIPRMVDFDRASEIIIKEYIDGNTVDKLVKTNQITVELVKQAIEMAETAKKSNLNIDYYPTNFVWDGKVLWYIDYECNLYDEKWSFEKWGLDFWLPQEFMDLKIEEMLSGGSIQGCRAMEILCEYSLITGKIAGSCLALVPGLDDKNSYVRTRCMRLILANARWGIDAKLIEKTFVLLSDPKPITIRQTLQALDDVIDSREELSSMIKDAVRGADFSAYASSMKPLLEKDRQRILG